MASASTDPSSTTGASCQRNRALDWLRATRAAARLGRVACAVISVTDSTNNSHHPRALRLLIAVLVSATVLWSALITFPTAARADGDPASDVLATQPLFLPQGAGIPTAQQGQLGELLQTAARNGYQIRIAVIASRSDLGSVTELWRQPQTYARFLDQELSLVYRGPLLIVMPNGFGFYDPGSPGQPPHAALAGVRIRAGGPGLAAATLAAVQRLAAASGHPVQIPPTPATGPNARSTNATSVVAFAIGAALIVLAWAASLRARPPRLRRRKRASG